MVAVAGLLIQIDAIQLVGAAIVAWVLIFSGLAIRAAGRKRNDSN